MAEQVFSKNKIRTRVQIFLYLSHPKTHLHPCATLPIIHATPMFLVADNFFYLSSRALLPVWPLV